MDVPALLLVAHSDDEVLGCSVIMSRLRRLTIMYATEARVSHDGIAGKRLEEALAALKVLGLAPIVLPCGLPDGSLVKHTRVLASLIADRLPDTALLITHAFEGGHPDHDACALAAQMARDAEEERSGCRVAHLEFAIYAHTDGAIRTNAFPKDAQPSAAVLALSPQEQVLKKRALGEFASQRHVVDRFPLQHEALRRALRYDFSAARADETVLFAMRQPGSELAWRQDAQAALAR